MNFGEGLQVACEIHVEGKFQMINIFKQELIKLKELQERTKKCFCLFYSQFSKSSSDPYENHPKGAEYTA